MLWIGLHLPCLSLESFAATLDAAHQALPLALLDGTQLAAANLVARQRGVKPGLKRSTALALAPQLLLGQADARRDAQALLAVAHAGLEFTPSVSLQGTHGVLLEVQPSLRAFGGPARLLQRLQHNAAALSQRVVFFDFDSFVVRDEYRPMLEAHAKALTANRSKRMMLEGHTDDRGGREYNLALGQKRAESVLKSMVLLGVSDSQLEAVSFGKERPAQTGSDEAAHAKNRRVELKDK